MKVNRAVVRSLGFASAMLLVCPVVADASGVVQIAATQSAQPVTFEVVKTNWVQRSQTNVIEIQMPKVLLVNEYRTNTTVKVSTNVIEINRTQWKDAFETNVTYVLRTNVVTRLQTNTVTVDRYRTNVIDLVLTNVVTAKATNWQTRFLTNTLAVDQYRTNRVDAFKTNLLTRLQTNMLVVDRVQTNQFHAYRTNLTTLNITNWQTVVVMRTNWITQPITNVVAIDLPASAPPLASATPSARTVSQIRDIKVATTSSVSVEDTKNLVLEWTRTDTEKWEIVLTLKSADNPGALLYIQEWRVEKTDKTVLLMGKEAEFRGELPPGTYNVTVKVRRAENSPLITLRGSINVTPDTTTHQVLVAAAGQRN